MTYADTYSLRTSLADWGKVANAIDGLLVGYQFTQNTSLINTTSTSLTDYTGATHSITVASGESLLILAQIRCSHSTDQGTVAMHINIDASDQTGAAWTSSEANTGGAQGSIMNYWFVAAPSVGAHTVKLQWSVDAGTGYSVSYKLLSLAIQTGA